MFCLGSPPYSDAKEPATHCRVHCMDGSCHLLSLTGTASIDDVLRLLHECGAIPAGCPELLLGHRILGRQELVCDVAGCDGLQLVLLRASLHVDLSDNSLLPSGVDALLNGLTSPTNQLRAVSLARTGLCGEEGGTVVARLLQACPGLEFLDISGNNGFGAVSLLSSGIAVSSIAAGIPTCYALQHLAMPDCGIDGSTSGRQLGHFLVMLPNLQKLDIHSNNHLGPDGVMAFAQTLRALNKTMSSLQVVNLGDTGIEGGAGGMAVAQMLARMPQLITLDLANNGGFGVQGLLAVGQHLDAAPDRILAKIDMQHCSLPRDLEPHHFDALLAKCPNMEVIDVGEEHAFDSLPPLNAAPRLRAVRPDDESLAMWHDLQVELAGASISASLQEESLNLGDASGSLNADAIVELCKSSHLRSLKLEHGSLTTCDDGIALARLLGAMDSLENLSLYGNHGFGAHALGAFVKSCPRCCSVRLLNLGECGLAGSDSGTALAHLVEKMPGLSSLHVRKNFRLKNDGVHSFASALSCNAMEALDLGGCSLAKRTAAAAILRIVEISPALRTLSVSGNPQLEETGLCLLVEQILLNTSVRSLSLASCGLSVQDMHLQTLFPSGSSRLESLDLSGNTEIGPQGLQDLLCQLPISVQHVDVSDCGLESVSGGAAIASLVQRCNGRGRLTS